MEDVLWRDVIDALGGEEYVLGEVKEGRDSYKSVPKELSGGRGVEVECEVVGLTSDGELALTSPLEANFLILF